MRVLPATTPASLPRLGLSTYAYIWRRLLGAWDLTRILDDTAAHGITVLQICDHPFTTTSSSDERISLREQAAERDISLEVGTKGVAPDHLTAHIDVARDLGATLLRSMPGDASGCPPRDVVVPRIRSVLPRLHDAGVTLALETYEQFATADLVAVIEEIDDPAVGICLDPGNSIARLETPAEVVQACAPHTVNLHVKDCAFVRNEGSVGFLLTGAPQATGVVDYGAMCDALEIYGRVGSHIVEHWMPRLDGDDRTCDEEARWVAASIAHLRAEGRCR